MRGKIVASLVAAGVVLSACGGSGGGGLLSRKLPDETRVIDGPSLAVPPDMQLRPPRQADDYEAVLRAQKGVEAQALITGVSATEVGGGADYGAVPTDDQWLLQQTGTVADPGVRQALEQDATNPEAKEKKAFWSGWFGKDEGDEE